MKKYKHRKTGEEVIISQICESDFSGEHPNKNHMSGVTYDPVNKWCVLQTEDGQKFVVNIGSHLVLNRSGFITEFKDNINTAYYPIIEETGEPVKPETKTIKEWFETLGEPLRSQALKNMDNEKSTMCVESLVSAIGYGFKWEDSNEGYNHWQNIYEIGRHGIPAKPEPHKNALDFEIALQTLIRDQMQNGLTVTEAVGTLTLCASDISIQFSKNTNT